MSKKLIKMDPFQLEPGMEIAEDLYTPHGTLIIGKGTVLTNRLISGLILLDLKDVPIARSKTEQGSEPVPEIKVFEEAYEEQLSFVKEKIYNLKEEEKINNEQLFRISQNIIEVMEDPKHILDYMRKLSSSNQIYTHSLNVALICHLFAQWLKFSNEVTKELVTAAILHDIGKFFSPDDYNNHPVEGARFLAKKGASKDVQLGVLMHHEKEDGSGFPTKARWNSIHSYAKIISIADYYDNATTGGKTLQERICPFKIIAILEKEQYGVFDITYMKTFLNAIADYFVGESVKLTDGRVGKIIFVNKHSLAKPIVEVEEKLIDLYWEKDLQVKELL